jgi:vitellogenic carboxypeptidase-like protein
LTENLTLERNPTSWTQHFDVLFVDNPVGTGYSYVDPPANVIKDNVEKDWSLTAKVPLSSLLKQYLVQQGEEYKEDSFVLQSPRSDPLPSIFETLDNSPFDQGYVTNQIGVAADIMTFLHEFYKNFPEKRKADLYIASESYGGQFPSISRPMTNEIRKVCSYHCYGDPGLQ